MGCTRRCHREVRPELWSSEAVQVSERFPFTSLRNRLFTPELQWQSRGQLAYLTGRDVLLSPRHLQQGFGYGS